MVWLHIYGISKFRVAYIALEIQTDKLHIIFSLLMQPFLQIYTVFPQKE